MHCLYLAEIYRPGAIFLQLIVCVYLLNRNLRENIDFMAIQGRRNLYQSKLGMRFPLVLHCNYVTILCRFETQRFIGRTFALFIRLTHPSLVWRPRKGRSLVNYGRICGDKKTIVHELPDGLKTFDSVPACVRRRTGGYAALAYCMSRIGPMHSRWGTKNRYVESSWPLVRRRMSAEIATAAISSIATPSSTIRPTVSTFDSSFGSIAENVPRITQQLYSNCPSIVKVS